MINIDIESFNESSQYEVLSTGTFFTKDRNDSVKFSVRIDDEFFFDVVLNFQDDKSTDNKSEISLSGNKKDNLLILTCSNFKDTGTGTIKPLEIASYKSKAIVLHFWSYIVSKRATRRIEYTFYRER